MVIEDGEGMATSGLCIGQGKMALEVHLPKPVRRIVFKAAGGRLECIDVSNKLAAVAAQDRCDRVRMGTGGILRQQGLELARAPAWIPVVQRQYRRFQRIVTAFR